MLSCRHTAVLDHDFVAAAAARGGGTGGTTGVGERGWCRETSLVVLTLAILVVRT